MPSIGAPSDAPWMPGISSFKPRSFRPVARSSTHSRRLSRSSRMPRISSSEMLDSEPESISSTRLRNHSLAASASEVASSMGFPSSEIAMEPSGYSIRMMLPLSSISADCSFSAISTMTSSVDASGSSGGSWRIFGTRPGVTGMINSLQRAVIPSLPRSDGCPLEQLLYRFLP